MSVLVTGAAGFVGFHVVHALAARGERVLGVDRLDGLNDASCPALAAVRLKRLEKLEELPEFAFRRADLAEPGALARACEGRTVGRVVHLAGRAGLRGADPAALERDNVRAQSLVLAFCRERAVRHLVHASSSAVYGGPGPAAAPCSPYGGSKHRGELLTRASAAEGGPPATSLRYFTLYGPWARPDTAAWIFAEAILAGRPVRLHGHGRMRRAFTFIDDAVDATLAALDRPPCADGDGVPHTVLDVRHPATAGIGDFVSALERALGRRALRIRVPAAPGEAMADAGEAVRPGCGARIGIGEGLARFADWYLETGRRIVPVRTAPHPEPPGWP